MNREREGAEMLIRIVEGGGGDDQLHMWGLPVGMG